MFWLNDGKGTFRAAPRLALRNTSNSSMAVDFSDIDRDGNVDIVLVDMLGRGPRRKTEVPTHTPLPKLIGVRSEEHTSELQSPCNLVCRLLLEKKKKKQQRLLTYPTNTYALMRLKRQT